jgi:alkanesulfonate monooxygenase SsuD/methylene tetrahydromethanopterin reductase-like flavin-dependent oxidoreductase (luciferase family)/ketosteroid isomerase-like protein
MPEETRRVVDALYAAYLAGDGPGMLRLMHDDVDVRFLGQASLHGLEEFRDFVAFESGLLRDLDFRIGKIIIDGDVGCAIWEESATTADGQPWENHGVDIIRVRDGRIVMLHENNDVTLVHRHFPRYVPNRAASGAGRSGRRADTMTANRSPVGLVLGSHIPPEGIASTARLAEQLGFGELWFAEDYFFTGGISGAATALAATSEIPVGLGIVSALVRHPALLAMEIATLSRIYPGRLRPGIGLGVPDWLRQMGLHPASPLGAVRDCLGAVRRLLDGEELTTAEGLFRFDHVRLVHPPRERVPLSLGVIGPKMLQLSGAAADGTILSVGASPAYVRWAREQIAAGAAGAGRTEHHRVTCFADFSVDRDSRRAREAARPSVAFYLAAGGANALTDACGISAELTEMLARGGPELVEREMPERWIADLAIAGDPEECAAGIRAYLDAGADSVALFPMPVERATELVELAAREILPKLG